METPLGTFPDGVEVPIGETTAKVWGVGNYGVILLHGAAYDAASWTPQAEQIAEEDMVVLALEDTAARNIIIAIDYMEVELGVDQVALIGASAGTSPALEVGVES